MKKVIIMAVGLLTAFSSCNKQNETKFSQSTSPIVNTTDSSVKHTRSYVESQVVPNYGKPSNTNYFFKVQGNNALALSVKLYARTSGLITYIPMVYSGGFWTLSTQIHTNDWYDWRYVYSVTKNNISNTAYTLCNTYNTFNINGTSSIRWPFGADGSSWSNKTATINGVQQQWLRGAAGGGYDTSQGTHTGVTEKYAVDWNRRKLVNWSPNDDLGAQLRSPLDGEVFAKGSYSTACCGQSNFVSVIQKGADNKTYRFFFGHMATIAAGINTGTKVRAGVTILGTLGSTGATSPHAHCSMRESLTNTSVKFEFNAQ